MRRGASIFLVGLLGCGPAGAPRDVAVAHFWYSYGGRNREVLEDLIHRFNDSEARAGHHEKIVGTFQGDYFEALAKLRAALFTHRAPALTHVIAEAIPALAGAGVLEDLGPWARGDRGVPGLDQTDLLPALTQAGTFDAPAGTPTVAIPFNRSTPILYYDQQALAEAGVAPPTTWQELADAARALTVRRGGRTLRYGLSCPLSWWFWVAALAQTGGSILTPDGRHAAFARAGARALHLYLDMAREGSLRLPPGRDFAAWERVHAAFLGRRAAMVITSTAFLAYITDNARFTVKAAPLPGDRRRAVPTGGTFFVLLARARPADKRAAWSFVRWMSAPEQTAEWARRTGYLPVSRRAALGPAMQELYRERPSFRVALDQLPDATPFPWSRALLAIEREAVQPAIEKAVLGALTPEEAMREAARIAEERLAEAR